jgi:hypothetical protein
MEHKMAVGKITMTPIYVGVQGELFLHIFSINNKGGVDQFVQGPDNAWRAEIAPANPGGAELQPAAFTAIKATGAIPAGVALALFALDANGLLWWATADQTGAEWGAGWQEVPKGATGTNYDGFDVVSDYYLGLVLVSTSAKVGWTSGSSSGPFIFNGQVDYRVFNDGKWVNGWPSPVPGPYNNYYESSNFPPSFSNMSIAENGAAQDDLAPMIAGVFAGAPLCLFVDPDSGDWQWSNMPAGIPQVDERGEFTGFASPYPVAFNSVFFTGVMTLIGSDGNIYFNTGDAIGKNWAFGGLINPPGMPEGTMFTKVGSGIGFPLNESEEGLTALVALGQPKKQVQQFPFLITAPAGTLNWSWQGPLPGGATTDFDLCTRGDTLSLQVALLSPNGGVFIAYQTADGKWKLYDGVGGTGLP